MKRIAVIFEGGVDNITGLTNAVISRVKALKDSSDYEIDVFDILSYPIGVANLFLSRSSQARQKKIEIDGVVFNMLWFGRPLLDSLLEFKLHKKPFFLDGFLRKKASLFKSYDLISAHSFVGAKLAYTVYASYNIPFCVTWHGSDVHSIPPKSNYQIQLTKTTMKAASMNFFVSKSLLDYAKEHLSSTMEAMVLYNGVNSVFFRYPNEIRVQLREQYRVSNRKVVAFVGNLKPVKNPFLLLDIFNRLRLQSNEPISFWLIGDGDERQILEKRVKELGINVLFWGYICAEELSRMLQCVDVLVLPSKNEGLGMVLLEAISCGANAVGSNVGGIPEVLSAENVFDLGPDFVNKISSRIMYFLNNKVVQKVSDVFSWEATALKELDIYNQII